MMELARIKAFLCLWMLTVIGCVQPQTPIPRTSATPQSPRPMDVIKAGLSYQDNPVVRAESVEVLESIASPEVLPWVRSALLDDHAGVRFAACMVLGRLKDAGATSMIRKCLADKDENVRVAAIYTMHRLGHAEQTGRLPNYVLLHPDPIVRRNAAIAISMLGQPSAVTVLARAMKDSDPGVRHHALEGMARLGNKEAARELSFMANSGVGSEEVFAINALAGTGDPVYEDAFRYKLSSGSHLETRLAAARALGKLGIDAGLPVVLDALKPNQPVRQEPDDPPADQLLRIRQLASAAAGAIGDSRAVPLLETYLNDGIDPRVQISAARALIEIAEKPGRTSSPFQASLGNR
jgi:HEAT repeat protein